MNKVSYTVAPFRFNKNIRYCFQYKIKNFTDKPTLHKFLSQFKGKSGLYCITTEEGAKIGVSRNLPRRLKEHITPLSTIKSLSFLVFNIFPYEELVRVENKIKSHYSDYTIENSSEFFKGLDGFNVFNQAKNFFFKLTSKRNRYKGPKVEFKHHQFKLTPTYTSNSINIKEDLNDFYS